MKYPMRKFLAYCMVLVFLFTCLPGSVLASTGDSASSGGAVEETENPADISDGSSAANPAVIPTEGGIEEALPDTAHGPSQQDISAQATVQEYINLQRFTGTYDVVGAAANAPSTSDYPNIASFQNGKIVCGNTGIADVQVQMTNGDTTIFHVSVYWEYPQPKTAKIKAGHNNVILQKFAKKDDTVGTGDVLNAGDTVQILYSASDQTSGASGATAGVMHYVKSGNKEGWIFSQENNHRVMDPYYQDIAAGGSIWISTTLSNIPQENNTWSHTGGTRISITTGTHNTYANQCKVTAGNSAGTATVTGTDTYHEASSFITVYTSVNDVGGRINKDTAEYSGATTTYPRGKLTNGTPVTINGESGNYWRIGENRFVRKSDVDIPATGLSIDPSLLFLSSKGDSKWEQLKATIQPSISTDPIVWGSSDEGIVIADAKGRATGIFEGSAVITATAGTITATCPVTVENVPISSITLDKTTIDTTVGKTETIKVKKIEPRHAYDKTILWESSDLTIASVDANGNITALNSGKVDITAKASVGTARAVCAVNVTAPAPPTSAAPSGKSDLNMRISKIHWTGKTDASKTFNILENTIAFDNISGATFYVLRRKLTEDGDYPKGEIGTVKSNNTATVLTIKDKKAFEGVIYKYGIDAYADENAYKKGERVKSETIMLTMKGAVKIKKVEAQTSKSIQVTWEKVKGATGYLIYSSRDKENKTFTLVGTVGENSSSYTHRRVFHPGRNANPTKREH